MLVGERLSPHIVSTFVICLSDSYLSAALNEQQQAAMKQQEQIAMQQQQQIKLQAEALESARAQQDITAKQVHSE